MFQLPYRKKIVAGTLGALVAFQALPLLAEELSILDCDGLPRAVRNVESNSKSKVGVVALTASGQPSSGVEFSLTQTERAQKIVASSQNGTATFSDVAPGAWTLCPASDKGTADKDTGAGVQITQVNIITSEAEEATLGTAAIIGGGSLAAGGTILGLLGSGSDGGSTTETTALVGSGSVNNPAAPEVALGDLPSSKPDHKDPLVTAAEGACLEEEEPEPISPTS